jgi:hypothetical protein
VAGSWGPGYLSRSGLLVDAVAAIAGAVTMIFEVILKVVIADCYRWYYIA